MCSVPKDNAVPVICIEKAPIPTAAVNKNVVIFINWIKMKSKINMGYLHPGIRLHMQKFQ